ncbi:hypothetical protein K7432_007519 [Basidiobolus ranarum]|uniref:Uncharacterized protein n=1 Tax=Basidiobolus ranarum TaxID=34480 RepID=A0ABR2VZZ4_9FUNG
MIIVSADVIGGDININRDELLIRAWEKTATRRWLYGGKHDEIVALGSHISSDISFTQPVSDSQQSFSY